MNNLKMEKQNLTDYSEEELSLIVFNDEGLYLQRNKPDFIELIDGLFDYSDEQKSVLIQDIQDDADENADD